MAILSFLQDDFEPGVTRAMTQDACAFHAQSFSVYANAGKQLIQDPGVGLGCNLDVVSFRNMGFRCEHGGGPLAVIGKQQQSFTGFVETADRSEPAGLIIQEVVDGTPFFFVTCSCHHATRFVEHPVSGRDLFDEFAVDLDLVLAKAHGSFHISPDDSVQPNPSRLNVFRGLGAGAESKFGERSRESDFARGQVSVHPVILANIHK